MATSSGSRVAASLAATATLSTWSSSNGSRATTDSTVKRFCVRVPVLSVQSTSMLAASSMAASRVTSTRRSDISLLPRAVANVKVAGRATGTEAMTSMSTKGRIS